MMAKSIEAESGGDFKTFMSTKADKTQLSELWECKSSKDDMKSVMKAIELSHHQLLHTIVMLIEVIKLDMGSG